MSLFHNISVEQKTSLKTTGHTFVTLCLKRCVFQPRSAKKQDTFVTEARAHCVPTSFFLFALVDKQFTCCFSPLFVLITSLSLRRTVTRVQQIQHEFFHWFSERCESTNTEAASQSEHFGFLEDWSDQSLHFKHHPSF